MIDFHLMMMVLVMLLVVLLLVVMTPLGPGAVSYDALVGHHHADPFGYLHGTGNG